MNQITLTGNLCANPSIETTPNGHKKLSFSVAVKRVIKSGGQETDFIPCTAWNSQAEYLQSYGQKGTKVGVVGYLQINQYQDREGNQKYQTNVVATSVEVLSGSKTHKVGDKQISMTEVVGNNDNDLPF